MRRYVFFLILLSLLAAAAPATEEPVFLDTVIEEIAEIGEVLNRKSVPLELLTLKERVINALITAIDPNAAIITEEQVARIKEEQKGVFYGIGLRIEIEDKQPVIAGFKDGSHAPEAGLKAGDIIELMDDRPVEGLSVDEIENMLRGHKGEVLVLAIRDEDADSRLRLVEIARELVEMPATGTMEEWPGRIGYIKIEGLYENSGERITKQLEIWMEKEYYGVIFDLRGAGGANLDSAAGVAGFFADPGESLFSVKDRSDALIAAYHAEGGQHPAFPIMVLVSEGTSEASEVLAATLKNRDGVLLLGTATKGDDSIREALPLSDNRMLYIATGRVHVEGRPGYYKEGITPDITVAATGYDVAPDDAEDDVEYDIFSGLQGEEREELALMARVGADPVLSRATDILLGVKALGIRIK